MPVLAFPGPAAPAPPPVTLEVPDGWHPLPPGADLLRAHGTGAAGDPVEVAVRHHTGPAGYAATDLVETIDGLPERPGAEVEPPFAVEIGGREWVARHVSWDEGSGPVIEVPLAAGVDQGADDDLSRLVVATGRVRGASLDADYDLLQSVLETLVVGGAR
ncbi:MAG: hypothetical protein ACJ711_07690 [Ornithinibacter sp.]